MDKMKISIIVSQIGYRPDDRKLAIIRCNSLESRKTDMGDFNIISIENKQSSCSGKDIHFWGEKWGIHFWTIDFSQLRDEGEYYIELSLTNIRSCTFKVAESIFMRETLDKTSIGQLDQKTGDKLGWQDCGSDLRAVEGHAVQLLGLIDCFESFRKTFGVEEDTKFSEHINRGADYLLICQNDDGSYMNEYYSHENKKSWTLSMMAAIALTRAYEVTDNVLYLNSAKKGWDYVIQKTVYSREELLQEVAETRKIFGRYSPWIPPKGLRVRDKLLIVWAGTELYKNTNDVKYKNEAIAYAEDISDRLQFLDYSSLENQVYGNFYAWEDSGIHQKSWEHIGWGYSCGAVLPDEISGFINLIEMFPEEKSWTKWRYTVRQYAYGYLKAVSLLTPFKIYSLGLFDGEIRFFGPSWHGFNGMYGRISRISMLLARMFEDPDFEFIAVQNMQWVAGLNTGIQKEGIYEGVSFINGVGNNSAKSWTSIEGSISNGFCANPQFKLVHMDDLEDVPNYLTTEDWIVHNGGWLSGLSQIEQPCQMKIKTQYKGKPVEAEVRIFLPEEHSYMTDHRGLLKIEALPVMRNATVQLYWNGHSIESGFSSISGLNKVLVADFSDHLDSLISVDSEQRKCILKVSNKGRDKTFINVFLRSEAVYLSNNEFESEIEEGQTREFQFEYNPVNESVIRPFYIYAEIAGSYSSSIYEINWKE